MHEPLIRDGVDGLEIAEEMEGLARAPLLLAAPIMEHVHQRWLQHFIEQDAVGQPELEVDSDAELGRLRVVIAFADLAGYTRLTEEAGEEEALDIVERRESVEETLPEDARVIKTIGDEVMVVGSTNPRSWTGPSASAALRRAAAAAAHRHPRGRPRCTATATTTGARSTSPRGSARAPRAARCW